MDSFIQFLSDPNVAYLLLTLGALGVLAELFHPGAILPGVAGAISLVLGFIGLGHLPFSWGGLALLALSAALFGLELASGASGLLSLGGLIAFVVGSLTLYNTSRDSQLAVTLSPWLVGLMSLMMVAFMLYVLQAVRKSRHAPVLAGTQALRSKRAVAISRLNPRGEVRLEGEVWTAEVVSPEGLYPASVEPGQTVEIMSVDGVILKVRAVSAPQEQWGSTGWPG
ncbi:MAG TPA: NfeD family protein [Chloroflexia bacterium]|nr:NfeD family protein [Chloroflexia bacterium]